MEFKRALIIISRLARQGDTDLQPVVDTLQRSGIDSILIRIDRAEKIHQVIDAYGSRVDRIVVGGGDGTLNASLQGVLKVGLALGILPLGTANDLARTLQIPPEPAAAGAALAEGHIHHIDLGRVNGRHFFLMRPTWAWPSRSPTP